MSAADPFMRRARITWASSIRPERQVWLLQDRIPVGTISALAGRGGTGKTTWGLHTAAQFSRGTLPGEFYGTPRNCLIWSGEDPWSTVLVPRLMAADADMDRIGRLSIDSTIDGASHEVTPRLPLDTDAIGAAITQTEAGLVLIDPIASTMSGDLHREADVRAALDALSRLAVDTGAVVMFVRHFGKGGGSATDKMSGNHAFRDACRSVFLFATDDETGNTVVSQDKGNYAPNQESFAFRLESVAVATDSGDASVARVVDLGASEITVDDVINRPAGSVVEERDEHDYTADFRASWLYVYLSEARKAGHRVRPKDAVAYASEKGISRRSVFRLFESLANAGLAKSEDGTEFPRVAYWLALDGTTDSTLPETGTTGTTGDDLHKQGGTTGESGSAGGTTAETVLELHEQAEVAPVVPVVPAIFESGGGSAPPGCLTAATPGQTPRVQQILARLNSEAAS